MSWESGKKALLNTVVAFGGILAGTWLGRSETIRSFVEKISKSPSGKADAAPGNDSPDADEKTSPLRGLKEHLQRKEGFRR